MTQDELLEALDYAPETGVFRWRARSSNLSRVVVGSVAGSRDSHGYWRIRIGGCSFQAHRLAWFCVHGRWPPEIDHVNGVRDDNRLTNLREVTHSQNLFNRGKQKNNRSGYKGVRYHKGDRVFRAEIKCRGIYKHLGSFRSAEEAHAAYCLAAEALHGDFARFE